MEKIQGMYYLLTACGLFLILFSNDTTPKIVIAFLYNQANEIVKIDADARMPYSETETLFFLSLLWFWNTWITFYSCWPVFFE